MYSMYLLHIIRFEPFSLNFIIDKKIIEEKFIYFSRD